MEKYAADKEFNMLASGRDELIEQAAQALASKREWEHSIEWRRKHPVSCFFDAIDDISPSAKVFLFISFTSIMAAYIGLISGSFTKNLLLLYIMALIFAIIFVVIIIVTTVCLVRETERLENGVTIDDMQLSFCYTWLYRFDLDLGYDHEKTKLEIAERSSRIANPHAMQKDR